MNMHQIAPAFSRFTAVIAAAFIFISGSASAQSVQLLGDYKDWSAYSTSQGAGKLCFVMSEPKNIEPEPEGFTKSYIYLTHRPAENIRFEFNFVAGFSFAAEGETELKIGGQAHELFVEGDAAWLADPEMATKVAGQMRAGSSMIVKGETEDGTKVVQTFSLSGVTAASRAIDRECR